MRPISEDDGARVGPITLRVGPGALLADPDGLSNQGARGAAKLRPRRERPLGVSVVRVRVGSERFGRDVLADEQRRLWE